MKLQSLLTEGVSHRAWPVTRLLELGKIFVFSCLASDVSYPATTEDGIRQDYSVERIEEIEYNDFQDEIVHR